MVTGGERRLSVLYHQPYPDGVGADRWICAAWQHGFEALGHSFHVLRAGEDLAARVSATRADLFFSAINLIAVENADVRGALQAVRAGGTRVLLWVHWPLVPSIPAARSDALRREDLADLYFGERESEQMAPFAADTGKPYHVVANAADPRYHHPAEPVDRYVYDVVYLGANLPKKRWFREAVLAPLRQRYRIGLFGPGWTRRDAVLHAGSKACRVAGRPGWAARFDRLRITVPVDEERVLYSSAKIALNFHEREGDGSQPHYIVNQRAFKIPACGGFQISDDVPALRKYFDADELVTAAIRADDWLNKIEYFLAHENERRAIQSKGTARALRDHMSTNRVQQVLGLLRVG